MFLYSDVLLRFKEPVACNFASFHFGIVTSFINDTRFMTRLECPSSLSFKTRMVILSVVSKSQRPTTRYGKVLKIETDQKDNEEREGEDSDNGHEEGGER